MLASTQGKVLVINEPYLVAKGVAVKTPQMSHTDTSSSSILEILLTQLQTVPGYDRCVLLFGCKEHMENMFKKASLDLVRQFPLACAFEFEDYSEKELHEILHLKLEQSEFDITQKARDVAHQCLKRERKRPDFRNARGVENILNQAILRHQKRLKARETRNIDLLEPVDFDPDVDQAALDCQQLLAGATGYVSSPIPSCLVNGSQEKNCSPQDKSSRSLPSESVTRQPLPNLPDRGHHVSRDVDVSDETWAKLQIDKEAEEDQNKLLHKLIEQEKYATCWLGSLGSGMETQIGTECEVVRELGSKRLALEKRKNYETSIQELLQRLNLYSQGYQWVKQHRGYRCTGGSHYISNEEFWEQVVQKFSFTLKS